MSKTQSNTTKSGKTAAKATKATSATVEAPALDWDTWKAVQLAAMDFSGDNCVPGELQQAARQLLALAEHVNNFSSRMGGNAARNYAGAVAALEIIRESCEVLEVDLKQWLATEVEYLQRRLANIEDAGLLEVAAEVEPATILNKDEFDGPAPAPGKPGQPGESEAR